MQSVGTVFQVTDLKALQPTQSRGNLLTARIFTQVFGETAKLINEGDRFVAKVGYVEGRKVVTLEKI